MRGGSHSGSQHDSSRPSDAGGRSYCLTRSMHALGRLKRPQHRALGAADTLEDSNRRLATAKMLTLERGLWRSDSLV